MVKTRKGWIWLAIVLSGLWVAAVCLHAHRCWVNDVGDSAWPYVSWRNKATGEITANEVVAEKVGAATARGDLAAATGFLQEHQKRFAWGLLAAVALAPLPVFWLLIAGLAWLTQHSRKGNAWPPNKALQQTGGA